MNNELQELLEAKITADLLEKQLAEIGRTKEDHELICRLVDHHEAMLKKLEYLVADAGKKLEEYNRGIFPLSQGYPQYYHEQLTELFDFAQELKDY